MTLAQASLISELKQLFEQRPTHPINRFYKWIRLLDRYEEKYLQNGLKRKDFLIDLTSLVIESDNTTLYNLYQNHFGKRAWGRLITQRTIQTSRCNALISLILTDYPRSRWQIDSNVNEQEIIRNIIMNTSDRLILKRISKHSAEWDFLFQEWPRIWAFDACLYCRPLTLAYFLGKLDLGERDRLRGELRSLFCLPVLKPISVVTQTIIVLAAYGTFFQERIESLFYQAFAEADEEEYSALFLQLIRLEIPLTAAFFERWLNLAKYPRYASFIADCYHRFGKSFLKKPVAAIDLAREKEWDQETLTILNPLTYLDKYLISFIAW